MEANGDHGLLRRREFHAQAAQIRALHSTNGAALHESARDSSGAEGHLLLANHWRQEEPELGTVHVARRHDQRYRHRGEHQRARSRHPGRQGRLGQVRAGHQSARERRRGQCCAARLSTQSLRGCQSIELDFVCKIK